MSRPTLSVVLPIKDEEDAIPTCISRVREVLDNLSREANLSWEMLFIDDGSQDGSLALLAKAHEEDPRIRCVKLSRNFGKEAALSAGIDHALGDAVVPLDVDLQDPPEILPLMIAEWRKGNDLVYGIRTNRESDSLLKRLTAELYYRAHNKLSTDQIPRHAGDFRLMDRKVVEVIKLMPERSRFMKGLLSWPGFKQASVSYRRAAREVGMTKFSYWKLWTLALDGITSASTVPLRIWTYVGAVVALSSFAYAGFIITKTLLLGAIVPGYASLLTAVLFLGGLQLLSLGILGEYVGRIFIETKCRPLYVVSEQIG